jgi:hypothetical protein
MLCHDHWVMSSALRLNLLGAKSARARQSSGLPSTIQPPTIANVSRDRRSEIAADPFQDFPKEKISDCGG